MRGNMKRLRLLAMLLFAAPLAAIPAMAQTSFYTDQALAPQSVLGIPQPVASPIPYGSVRVCSLPLTQAQPCLPLATITDAFGGSVSNNIGSNFGQLTTDVTGRFAIGCTLGNSYQVQIQQSLSNSPAVSYPFTCPGASNNPNYATLTVSGAANLNGGGNFSGTFSGTPTFSGLQTFNAGLTSAGPNTLNGGGTLGGTYVGNFFFNGTMTIGSSGITPSVAGNAALGSVTLPWNSIFLGSAANQNVQIFPSGLTANRTATWPDISGGIGVSLNAVNGAYQSKRGVAGCTTAASIGGVCAADITVTWPTAFSDTNYSVTCTGNTPTNVPAAPFVVSGTKLAATVHINYFAITAAAASYSTIDCIAVHD